MFIHAKSYHKKYAPEAGESEEFQFPYFHSAKRKIRKLETQVMNQRIPETINL